MSGFEAGLAVFICTHRVVLGSFRLSSSFSVSSLLLCAPLGASGLLSLPAFVLVEALHVWFFFFFFSSLVIHIVFCCLRACVKLERLRLSRKVVKLEHVRLTDCFKEPGWATTSRRDLSNICLPGESNGGFQKTIFYFYQSYQRHHYLTNLKCRRKEQRSVLRCHS